MERIGIACASGSAKGVFVHGVLSAFERLGLVADVYAASSSSTIPAAFACIHQLALLGGVDYWKEIRARYMDQNPDMSKAVKHGIDSTLSVLVKALFEKEASRFAVAVSEVISSDAAELTQGDGARMLGRRLMLSIRKGDNSWARDNLAGRLFDTRPTATERRLTPSNLADVLYATTRMLHAWKDPAWIEGRPFIDASYTCVTPAIELAELGFDRVVAISPESGPRYRDFFRSEVIPDSWKGTVIDFIQPVHDLAEIGVDYLKATDEGLETAYQLGRDAGSEFVDSLRG